MSQKSKLDVLPFLSLLWFCFLSSLQNVLEIWISVFLFMNSTVHNMVFRFLKQLESPKKPTEKGIGPPTVIREPKKGPPDKPEGRRRVGACLFSRAASSQVSWAQMGLTAVFGMGTGVPPPPSAPTIFRERALRTEQREKKRRDDERGVGHPGKDGSHPKNKVKPSVYQYCQAKDVTALTHAAYLPGSLPGTLPD